LIDDAEAGKLLMNDVKPLPDVTCRQLSHPVRRPTRTTVLLLVSRPFYLVDLALPVLWFTSSTCSRI